MPSLVRRLSSFLKKKSGTQSKNVAGGSSSSSEVPEAAVMIVQDGETEDGTLPLPLGEEFPAKADLRTQIYRPLPVIQAAVDPAAVNSEEVLNKVIKALQAGLDSGDTQAVKDCFFGTQSYWRDVLALTYHLRTLNDKETITPALLHLNASRKVTDINIVPGTASCVPAMPTLTWVQCFISFRTASPAATCGGMLQLLPEVQADGSTTWKIWTLTTWLHAMESFSEDESRLREPARNLGDEDLIKTDVFIVGAGNAGLVLAARLKAMGCDYLCCDRNANIGDNWAMRYDCMRFHVPTFFAQTPYLPYPEDSPNALHRDDLANHMKRFASEFHLNVLLSTSVKSSHFDSASKKWTVKLQTPAGPRTVVCTHLVQATGVGSGVPYIPKLENESAYKGLKMHSAEFKSGKLLAEKGIKSVIVVGAANTAFDILNDCHAAGIAVTVIQRTPTYVIPMSYFEHPQGLGMYKSMPAEIADAVTQGGPLAVGGQLLGGVHMMQAMAEPYRYKGMEEAGFKVLTTQADLMHNLLERAGGHWVELGNGVDLITSKKVAVKSGVSPVAFTEGGVKLSDDTMLDADAVIFCTGYKDKNVREVAEGILGQGGAEIARKMDATWGLDKEGEIRGMWKRQEKLENFWLMGGFASQHRFFSRVLALQLKAAVDGTLPEAYRKTPATLA